jgi:hypothetical protein
VRAMKWLLIMPTHGITSGWLDATVRLIVSCDQPAAGIASALARMVVLSKFMSSSLKS